MIDSMAAAARVAVVGPSGYPPAVAIIKINRPLSPPPVKSSADKILNDAIVARLTKKGG